MTTERKRTLLFFAGFALVALVLAGVVSYFADSNPDGLEVATRDVETDEHRLAGGPLADYAVGGDDRFTGVAGVLGVIATLAVAFGVFFLLRKRSRT